MERRILKALEDIQKDVESQTGAGKLSNLEITLSQVLRKMGIDTTGQIPYPFYSALEKLENQGLIYDFSYTNAGFGRTRGTDGEIGYSIGTKISLA
ncbi:Uncharacterised protein [Serratia quinivorans]|uniref:hypothetical protein n=1 Tax=Serratia quinivorans TaxID=137545 RepID=UPI002177897F|nr:hypothetical protein [Serratia quinivorans]CAI1503365.1 Uncharacterised protein [Serratia quinivorans]